MLFPEDGMRHELIDGEHYVTPAPFLRHQEIDVVRIYRRADDRFGRPAECRAALATCSPRNCCRDCEIALDSVFRE